ncbi:MAG: hypothetical protein LBI35_01105 [Burkholderiales bacterium]|jgi:hypothetical protein|nr:hypothetical protein [Burkholderiales bacterium]
MNYIEILKTYGDRGAEIVNALEVLRREVNRTSLRKVSARLGYSITALSLILNDKYSARLDKVATAVMEMIARFPCPHTGAEISQEKCQATCMAKAPTHNPMAMRQWRCCKTCQHGQKFLNTQESGGNKNVASGIER